MRITASLIMGALMPAVALAQCVSSFPSLEDFEGFTVGTPGTLVNNWTNLSGDDIDWNVDANGTPSQNTGPSADHSLGTTAGKYMYIEATSPNFPNKVAILESPCYDLTGASDAMLTFWYHMYGAEMGSLAIDLMVNGTPVTDVLVITGDQGNVWRQAYVDLSAHVGQNNLRVRFRGTTGSNYTSDITIDDVRLAKEPVILGCTDPNAGNYDPLATVDDGTCTIACPANEVAVEIQIVPDNYPTEISWDLVNGSTTAVLASGGSSGTTVCVPENACLVFTINDSYGDGICCGYGNGSYSVFRNGVLVATGGNYGSSEQTVFNCPPGFSCSEALVADTGQVYTAPTLEFWYDFTPPETGAYTITTCGLNTCDTKVWVYDADCSQITLSDGVEGATFADDDEGGCGLQAVVSANMPGGVLHHIRIGTNNGDCSQVQFEIIFNGPVVGCMDPGSCNYDPLATVDCGGCCMAPGDPNCPDGPDLTLNQADLENSIFLTTVNITDACAPVEGCTRGMGQRYVLRFSTRIDNIGTTDYYIGSPNSQPQMFDFNNCHGHAHYAGYADYLLFDQNDNAIPVGFKNGFCVIDVGCFGGTGQYGCSNMGISAGCYDRYGSGTTCNWIDITDVPAGEYTLVLRTNWQQAPDALGRHEQDYTNNYAQLCIEITRDQNDVPSFSVLQNCPTWTDCAGIPYGDSRYDCTGTCGGITQTGDLNSDAQRDAADAIEYVTGILGNDVSASACTDLNGDGLITVTDGALLANCYNTQDAHDQSPHVLHYHPWCDYPRGWLSTLDTAWLSLGNFDPVGKTVDIFLKNPNSRVLGYEFDLSGLTIQSVENLSPNVMNEMAVSSSLGGTKVIGLSYIDSSIVKSSAPMPLCRVHYLTLTDAQICIADIADIVNEDANNIIHHGTGDCLTVPNTVVVDMKAWLEGPFSAGQMNDALRAATLLPSSEPYTGLGFSHVGGGGGETVLAGVFDVTGPDAVVDWVMVELRDANAPATIVSTRSALLQRDGDIVGMDGTSPVVLFATPGNYHVALRHRNHLGVMTASAVALGATATTIDLRTAATPTWGSEARKDLGGGAMGCWMGNTVQDGQIKYTGSFNDRDPIISVIGGTAPTNVVIGYYREDSDLSGIVKYTGSGNDRDPILNNIGGVVPTNTRTEQLP